MKRIAYLFVMLLLMSGCATPLHQKIAPNRENLLKLSIGISKEETIKIMGTKAFSTYSQGNVLGIPSYLTITNPYRSEILQGKDNKTFEVIYYVTDVKNDDNAITDDELTPLIFDNSKLIGWGWSFLNDNIQKYEIRMR